MTVEIYAPQVSLLLRAIPEIAIEDDFALKGGTAINLFVRNRPRLSVDIDLVYLPVTDRESSLAAIDAALDRIAARLRKRLDAKVDKKGSADGKGLLVRTSDAGIQIELSPVLRGTL